MSATNTVRINGSSEKIYSSDALDFYKEYWLKGDEVPSHSIEQRNAVLDAVFPSGLAGKRIAELGVGGEGGFLYLLKDHNETFGFDASEAAIDLCRRRDLNVRLTNLDADGIPLPDNSIDVVFAMEVFEHFASPQFVLENIRRILSPQGVALISTPNPLIYHWPRLFYPELFCFDAFHDFLMINGFKIEKKLGSKSLPFRLPENENKAWHWLWYCSKLDATNARMLFEFGLHFWDRKDANGFRKKPIEAIDLFRLSHQLEPEVFPYRCYLARALIYRTINGESDEFARHHKFLTDTALNGSPSQQRDALYHLAMMYVEFEKLGCPRINKSVFDATRERLSQIPGSGPYVEKIANAASLPAS